MEILRQIFSKMRNETNQGEESNHKSPAKMRYVCCATLRRENALWFGHDYLLCFESLLGSTTDLSKLSRPSVRYALEIGLEQGAEVIVYHGISEDGDWFGKGDPLNPARTLVRRQKERLRQFVEENFADMAGKVRNTEAVEPGIPYDKIVKKAEEENVDMIVMSTYGRTGLEQILLGSVTAKVVARANCPILSIRPGRNQ